MDNHLHLVTIDPNTGLMSEAGKRLARVIEGNPVDRGFHTQIDAEFLVAAGADPTAIQARDRPSRCWCGRETWNLRACCDEHYELPGQIAHTPISHRWSS